MTTRSRYNIVDSEGIDFVTETILNPTPVLISEPPFEIGTGSLTPRRREKKVQYLQTFLCAKGTASRGKAHVRRQ